MEPIQTFFLHRQIATESRKLRLPSQQHKTIGDCNMQSDIKPTKISTGRLVVHICTDSDVHQYPFVTNLPHHRYTTSLSLFRKRANTYVTLNLQQYIAR